MSVEITKKRPIPWQLRKAHAPPSGWVNVRSALLASIPACTLLVSGPAHAVGSGGDVIQTDSVGMNLVTYDFTSQSTKTVSDAASLSEFIGLHYYFANRWRLGMNLQFTEQLTPSPPRNESYFRSYAFLPQIGWNFADPFFAALVYKIAPRINGQNRLDMAVQGLFGVGRAISSRVRLNFAVEFPFAFYVHRTLGVTGLMGISIRL